MWHETQLVASPLNATALEAEARNGGGPPARGAAAPGPAPGAARAGPLRPEAVTFADERWHWSHVSGACFSTSGKRVLEWSNTDFAFLKLFSV